MSELVKRLRTIAEFIRGGGVAFSTSNAANDYQEAANRIEELEAGLLRLKSMLSATELEFERNTAGYLTDRALWMERALETLTALLNKEKKE